MITPLLKHPLLVGSRAVQYYLDLQRPVKDWDLWQLEPVSNNQIIFGELVDYHQISPQEFGLVNTLDFNSLPIIQTPVGLALVTPLWFNFLLKSSHYSLNKKAKHTKDYLLLNQLTIDKPKNFDSLLLQRFLDTQKKQEDFFEEDVPRFLPHDWVHLQVAQGLGFKLPAFISLLGLNNYTATKESFNKLPKELQLRCVLEECIVLGLERWLIYNVALTPGSLIERWEVFCSRHSPACEWLERLGAKGRVRRNPEYISDFIQDNYLRLMADLPLYLTHLRTNMPPAWWTGLLGIRCEKKAV